MHPTTLIENGVLIRVIRRPCLDQCLNQGRLAAHSTPRDDDSPATPAYDASMEKHPAVGLFRDV